MRHLFAAALLALCCSGCVYVGPGGLLRWSSRDAEPPTPEVPLSRVQAMVDRSKLALRCPSDAVKVQFDDGKKVKWLLEGCHEELICWFESPGKAACQRSVTTRCPEGFACVG